MIHFSTWLWGKKYPANYLQNLEAAVARNYCRPYRFHVWRPGREDIHLTKRDGCFARLRTFDPAWQAAHGIEPGERIVCLDLDLVVTGILDQVFDRPEPFVILQGVNAANPCPYNGSVWMLRAGYRPDVWQDFSLEAAAAVPHFAFPDDQAWLHAKIPHAASFGPMDGVYAFKKPGWPSGVSLPKGARIVAFPGHRDPAQFAWLLWIKQHWAGLKSPEARRA